MARKSSIVVKEPKGATILVQQDRGGALNRGGNPGVRVPIGIRERCLAFVGMEGIEVLFDIVRGKPTGDAKARTQVFPTFGERIQAFREVCRASGLGKNQVVGDTAVLDAFVGAIQAHGEAGHITHEVALSIVSMARESLREAEGVATPGRD